MKRWQPWPDRNGLSSLSRKQPGESVNSKKNLPASQLIQLNLQLYEFGQLDGLTCPVCSAPEVSVYFDGPKVVDDQLWTHVYFFCNSCKHWDRTPYQGLPPHFDEKRGITEAQR